MRIVVIGMGTRHGDDAAGLLAARRLAALTWPPDVRVLSCEGSPLDVIDALEGTDAAILIDAIRSGQPVGTVRPVPSHALRPLRPASSHALGVAEVLALAAALGCCPPRLELVGIEGERVHGEEISPSVLRGVAEACDRVRARVAALLAGDAPSSEAVPAAPVLRTDRGVRAESSRRPGTERVRPAGRRPHARSGRTLERP